MTANTESTQRCSQRRTLNMGQIWFPFETMFICSEFVSATMHAFQWNCSWKFKLCIHSSQIASLQIFELHRRTPYKWQSHRAVQTIWSGDALETNTIYLKHLMLYSDGRFARHPCFRYFALNTEMCWRALQAGRVYIHRLASFTQYSYRCILRLKSTT